MPNWCPEEDEDTDETSETEEVFLTSHSYWTWQETSIFDKPDPPTENWTGT